MTAVSFTERRYSVETGSTGPEVVCHTVVGAVDAAELATALAHVRRVEHGLAELESAEQVQALRELVAVEDMLAHVGGEHGAPVLLTRSAAVALAEAASRYRSDRDDPDGHVPARERDRIARLGVLGHRLLDLCAELAEAEREAVEKGLLPAG